MKNSLTKEISKRVKEAQCPIQKELKEQHEMLIFNRMLLNLKFPFENSKKSNIYEMC